MRTALLIAIVAASIACNRSHADRAAAPADTATKDPNASAAPRTTEKVTLVGCLTGPDGQGAVGTAGSPAADRARSRAEGGNAAERQHGAAAPGARFVLSNAAVESGGVGANGAGASGGPLVSAGSSFELDGLPADAQANVNKRVRVTGRIDPRPATPGATSGSATRAGDTSAGAAPSTTGGTSARDDVRANSTAVAGDPTSRVVTVETVQVVAERCENR